MADFCNICLSYLDKRKLELNDIVFNNEDQFNINEIFHKHIKPNITEILQNNWFINLPDFCEHCGLSRFHLEKENDILYLVAYCWKQSKENNTGTYKIAIINDRYELEYQLNEISKMVEEK